MWRHGPPQYPEFVAASAICCVIILLPISSHWKARNVATLSMIAWLFTVNFYRTVNSIIWANNVDELIPVWCDISTCHRSLTDHACNVTDLLLPLHSH